MYHLFEKFKVTEEYQMSDNTLNWPQSHWSPMISSVVSTARYFCANGRKKASREIHPEESSFPCCVMKCYITMLGFSEGLRGQNVCIRLYSQRQSKIMTTRLVHYEWDKTIPFDRYVSFVKIPGKLHTKICRIIKTNFLEE